MNRRTFPWLTIAVYSLSLCLYGVNSLLRPWLDEYDVYLGGRAIAGGQQLYTDYIANHMPFAYYAGAALYTAAGDNLVLARVLWSLLLFGCVGLLHIYLRHTAMARTYLLFPVVLPLASVLLWGHTILSETIAFYALFTLLLLTLFRLRTGDTSPLTPVVCGALGFIVPATTLSYAPAAAFMLLAAFYYASRARGLHGRFTLRWLTLAGWFALVPGLLTGLFVLTGAPRLMIEQAYTFNIEYYSAYSRSFHATWQMPFYIVLNPLRHILTTLAAMDFETYRITTGLITATVLALVLMVAVGLRGHAVILGRLFLLMLNPRMATPEPDFLITYRNSPFLMFMVANLVITFHVIRHSAVPPWLQPYRYTAVAFVALWGYVALRGVLPILERNVIDYQQLLVESTAITDKLTLTAYDDLAPLLEPGEPVWSGPYRLEIYLALPHNPIAARMPFYQPFFADSAPMREGLLHDLEQNRPPLIYFVEDGDLWNVDTRVFAVDVLRHLDRHYLQVSDPALENVYVRRDMAAEMTRRIQAAHLTSSILPDNLPEDRRVLLQTTDFVMPFDAPDLQTSDGVLDYAVLANNALTATVADDPSIALMGLDLCAADYAALRVDVVLPGALRRQEMRTQVFFAPAGEPFTADRVVSFVVDAAQSRQVFVAATADIPGWTGTVDSLRIDPATGGNGDAVQIMDVRLIARDRGQSACE